jgi:hypothetical protein
MARTLPRTLTAIVAHRRRVSNADGNAERWRAIEHEAIGVLPPPVALLIAHDMGLFDTVAQP